MRDPFRAELTTGQILDLLGASCDDDFEDASLNLGHVSVIDLLDGLAREEDYRNACIFELVARSRAAGFDTRLSEYLASLNLRSTQ